MMQHAQIAQRAFNTPLLVDPSKALAFLSGLGSRITGQEIIFPEEEGRDADLASTALPARASLIGGDLARAQREQGSRPFVLVDGIAIIEITGTLVHRGSWIGKSSGVTSCEGIAAQIEAAIKDPGVRGIALEIDSFGGEVAGVFDLADRIRAARAEKTVEAFVAEHALSAGYALASQADRITLPRTGAVGSIGVVTLHTEMSGLLEQKGVAVTLLHAGAHKIDANPYAPLPPSVRNRLQVELEGLRKLFAETVAKGRGDRLNVDAALLTEAAIYHGVEAVTAGLADAVSDPQNAFRAFVEGRRDPGAIARLHNPSSANNSKSQKESPMKPDATPSAKAAAEPGKDLSSTGSPPTVPPTHAPEMPTSASAPVVAAAPQIEPLSPNIPETPVLDVDAIRAEAAEVAQICAQAARLGVAIDAADAVKRGLKPDALRTQVLSDLAARSDAAAIIATVPTSAVETPSPLVAAAKKAAAEAQR